MKSEAPLSSLEECIQYAKSNFQDNLQCRLLAKDQNWIKNKADDAVGMDELFARAAEKLKQFDLVMLTERFDESLLLARRKLNWQKPPYYFRINKTPNKPSRKTIDSSVIRQIETLQVYDRLLYDLACQRFEAAADELPSSDELATFQRKNRYYQNYIVPLNKIIRKIPGFQSKRLIE